MNSRSTHEYQVEFYIRSNLKSHQSQPFTFVIDDAQVTILSTSPDADSEGFVAQVVLRDSSIFEAEQRAHDVLSRLLDILCYEMRVSGLITRNVRTQVEDSGDVRRCAVYGHEHRSRPLFLMKAQADEVRRFLTEPPDTSVRRALYWLRWSYCARTVPEAFLFVWMAVERLVGEEQVPSRCSKCREPMKCDIHGESSHSSVQRDRIRELLERHQVGNIEPLLRLRNPLVHGSLEYSFAERAIMYEAVPRLSKVVEEELRIRLGATTALRISPLSGPGDDRILVHCEYRTSFPDQRFPSDCPSFAEIDQHLKRSQIAHHPKIIDLLSWPPEW
jgi:hypothetical protein